MQIIHVFWSPCLLGVDNNGRFHLWVETSSKQKDKNLHPYHLSAQAFSSFCEKMKWIGDIDKQCVQFPTDENQHVLLSPVIANINDFNEKQYHQHTAQRLQTLEILAPFSFLKELNYQHFSFDDDVILGDDAEFWIAVMHCIADVLKKDAFIPAVICLKNKKTTTYQNKWEIISSDFDSTLKQFAQAMPLCACLGDFSFFEKHAALQHVSDVLINNLIASTRFSNKNQADLSETLLEGCLPQRGKPSPISNTALISQWASWRNQLQHEQFGADFNLCFRLIDARNEKSNDWGISIQLQSKKDPSFFVDLSEYWQKKEEDAEIYRGFLGEGVERQLLLQLGYACRVYPLIENVFNTAQLKSVLPLRHEEALSFLREEAWQLKSYGYRIIVPSWWSIKGRNKFKIKLTAKASASKSGNPVNYIGKEGLIDFDHQISMGNQRIDEKEWDFLINAKSDLVYFRGEWVEIDKEEMEKVQALAKLANKEQREGNIQTLLQLASDDEHYETEFDDHIQLILGNLKNQEAIALIDPPKNLHATLRPYQLRGVSWLCYLEKLGMNPCLADDMGLGKTMQIIALLLAKPQKNAALLIAPTSVIGNWFKELEKFAPSIKALIHHGNTRTKEFFKAIEDYDIVITSYGLIRKDKALFDPFEWSRVIIDEAQNIKNPTAAQTKAIFNLKAQTRIALSGTPIENRLMDLWSIFNFLNPNLLSNKNAFRKQFELPVQRENDIQKKNTLKNLITPFILRRLKTDKSIIQDLPEKIEQKVYCELSVEQASLYQLIVDEIKQEFDKSQEEKGKKLIMLSALLRLKQCCNHPAQYLQDASEFSPDRSIKLQRLIETTQEAIQNNESILIFSQFTDICEKLQGILKNKLGYTTHYLHGGTPRKQREKMIEEFQSPDSAPSVFILSLKAGGVGITLTKANHVIHFDRWWNPAVENQATDRAYRIGQKKTVFAHKFITIGTIEEKIDAMLEEKQALADGIIGSDESWLTELSTEAFMKMIELNNKGVA